MILQLAKKTGEQIKALLDVSFDAELNDNERDFELTVPLTETEVDIGCRVFVPGTEIGGILGQISGDSRDATKTFQGYGWRGMLANRVIKPPDGQDYYTVTGELNTVLRTLIGPLFDGLFLVPEIDTGVTVTNYQFDRFCTLLDGLSKMLKSVNYRLEISYNEGEPNGSGWVEVQAVPITDYSDEIELSQDSQLNFSYLDKQNGVNHLVVGGKGELQERNIIHLYVQGDGFIGTEQYYFGADEIEQFYENTSTETEELLETGKERLQELMNKKTFEMDVETLGIDVAIGDIIGGRDYNTGISVVRPLGNIIVQIKNCTVSKDYKLEGT